MGRRGGVRVHYDPAKGKGSHETVYYGARRTALKDPKKELGTGLLADMCKDLGIDPREL
jgi:mRNA interferase HicA